MVQRLRPLVSTISENAHHSIADALLARDGLGCLSLRRAAALLC